MTSKYVKTKFAPPHYSRPTITRRRILDHLVEEHPDVVVIHAPSGYGKTTLAVQMRQKYITEQRVVAWLNFDQEDDTEEGFIHCILLAFAHAGCGFADEALALFNPGLSSSIEKIRTAFANDLINSGAEYCLFIDDLHLGKTVRVQACLRDIMEKAGSKLKLVLISRMPEFTLPAALELNQKAAIIRVGDLQFSFEEAKLFFAERLKKASLDLDDQRFVFDVTEGWISALDWAAMAIAKGSSSRSVKELLFDDNGALSSRFPDKIMRDLPRETKSFLCQTSVLDSFNHELASEVTGFEYSRELIEQLAEEYYFFLPVEDEPHWFRYHPIFLTALQRELLLEYEQEVGAKHAHIQDLLARPKPGSSEYTQATDDLSRPRFDPYELHRRAAQWYLNEGYVQQALKHYLTVNDVNSVIGLLEQSAQKLLEDGKLSTLLSWAHRLPEKAIHSKPRLLLAIAWAYTLSCRSDEARQLIDALEHALPNLDEIDSYQIAALRAAFGIFVDETSINSEILEHPEPTTDGFSIAAAHNCVGFAKVANGKYDEARETVTWVEQKPDLKSIFFPYIYRQSVFALSYALEGRFEDSNKIARAALDVAETRHGRRSAPACVLLAVLSDGYYEQDRLEELREYFSYRFDVINTSVYPDALIRAYVSAAKTFWALGEPRQSLELLDQLYSYGKEHGYVRVMANSLAEKLRQAIHSNQLTRAKSLLERLETMVDCDQSNSPEAHGELELVMDQARVQLAMFTGQYSNALEILNQVLASYQSIPRRRLRARVHLLRSVANFKSGKSDLARADFVEALTIGALCRLRRCFIDERKHCETLLNVFRGDEQIPDELLTYLQELLEPSQPSRSKTIDEAEGQRALTRDLQIRVSGKEHEVLSYLSQGLTNKRIAQALNVSPETIRWHLKNIFAKLEVNTRYDAVGRAKALGLI